MNKKILNVLLVVVFLSTSFTVYSNSNKEKKTENSKEMASEVVELNYWTWFPNQEQMEETITAFESANPGIKIKMNVMESSTFQQKIPLALSTGEDIDIVGVQPSEFATGIQDYLTDLNQIMPKAVGSNWADGYSKKILEKGKTLTGNKLKFITILNSGSMIGFYNAALLKELGKEVPKTIDEYEDVANALYAKYPDKLAGVFAGLDAWVDDEMMLTILGQQGDYYNKWIYENASLDSQEYIDALNGLKEFFDRGIFSKDIMDLGYGDASETFANGNALVYYMGSWEAPFLSSKLRSKNGIKLEDVGAMALPVVQDGGVPTIRSYMDCGLGIVNSSKKQDAAAKFVAFCSTGDGVSILSKQFVGTPGMESFDMDQSLLTSDSARKGWDTLIYLMNNATADRKNESSFGSAVQGPAVQEVILGTKTAEEVVVKMQKEWTSGNY